MVCRIVDAKKWGVPRRSEDAVRKINEGAMQDIIAVAVRKEGKYFNIKKIFTTNKEVYL